MASISLGNQKFIGNSNFTIAMITELATQLLGKNVTITVSGTNVAIAQGGTQIGTFDLQDGGREVWASIADVLFSGASVTDIHVDDRIVYTEGYEKAIDWRDMANSIDINENRYADGALTVAANNAAFTVTGFGTHFQKVIGAKLQRNDSNNAENALMEIGSGNAFMRVNTSNEIQFNSTIGSASDTWANLTDANGNITLGSGSDNFLVFEIVRTVPGSDASWDIVADFYDGTNYHECNNLAFAPGTLTGDNLGFSRSSLQRGQITRFSAMDSSGYLRHSQLDNILRQHQDDKWNFGYARLIAGGNFKEVDFISRLGLPAGSTLGGEALLKNERDVYQSTGKGTTTGQLVSSVTLPVDYTDYNYVHVTEYDVDSLQWRHSEIPVQILSSGLVTVNDNVRLQGNTVMSWVNATRLLAMTDGAQEIYRVTLKD